MTDDEAITLALLHGCKFFEGGSQTLWYVINAGGPIHPLEEVNKGKTDMYGFETREALARAYCEHFGLGMDVATIKTHKEEP